MTAVEKHIRHFNLMNGNVIRKDTLEKFLAELPKDPALNQVRTKVRKMISHLKRDDHSAEFRFKPVKVKKALGEISSKGGMSKHEKLITQITKMTDLDYDFVKGLIRIDHMPKKFDSARYVSLLRKAMKKETDPKMAVAVAHMISTSIDEDPKYNEWRSIKNRGGDISESVAMFREYGIKVPKDLIPAPPKKIKSKPAKKLAKNKTASVKQGVLSGVGSRRKPGTALSGFTTADQTPEAIETEQLPGEIGRFLQNLQRYKLAIVVAGETHSSKSEIGKQIADAFISSGDEVAWIDWEQGGLQSKDTVNSIHRNISPENRKKLFVRGDLPKTLDAVKGLAAQFPVVVLDSGSSLKLISNAWMEELREQHPDTVWIILMQQNASGKTKGGASAEFDMPVVIYTYRPDKSDFRKNYAELFKNRGNKTGLEYNIAAKQIVQPLTQAA